MGLGLGKRLPSTSRICLAKDDDRTCVRNICGQNCGNKSRSLSQNSSGKHLHPLEKVRFHSRDVKSKAQGSFWAMSEALLEVWENRHVSH